MVLVLSWADFLHLEKFSYDFEAFKSSTEHLLELSFSYAREAVGSFLSFIIYHQYAWLAATYVQLRMAGFKKTNQF